MLLLPMLAEDANEAKLRYPVIAEPKIDGVRGVHIRGRLTSRTLKPHGNLYTENRYSDPKYTGLDGEFLFGPWIQESPCSATTSAITTRDGEPALTWTVFDYVTTDTIGWPYARRLEALSHHPAVGGEVTVTEYTYINSHAELLEYEELCLLRGAEGIITRDPTGAYKSGRSTVREGGLLRIKRFVGVDCTVLNITEADENTNEKKTDELGRSHRSSAKAGKVGKGMVGNLLVRMLEPAKNPLGRVVFATGTEFVCGPGKMPHNERTYYWEHPESILGHRVKVKMFLHGVKDMPRFPTFVSFRSEADAL